MYDQCVIALGYDPDMEGQSEEVEDLVEFLEYEGSELRDELQEFEDGTHAIWAPFKEMLSSDDPDAVAMRYRGAKTQKRMDQHRQAQRELLEKTLVGLDGDPIFLVGVDGDDVNGDIEDDDDDD